MHKKLITVLVIVALVLVLLIAGAVGFLWYRDNHVFVEGKAYPIHAESLDLREESISFDHYDQLHKLLPDCEILWNVPFQNGSYSSDSASLTVTGLTDTDIGLMETYFPKLRQVDAAGCSDYDMLEKLCARLPDVKVSYQVNLGTLSVEPDTTELTLEPGDFDLGTLTKNIPHLKDLTTVTLNTTTLTLEEIEGLRAQFPEITFTYTVTILGQTYEETATEMDLSSMTSGEVSEAAGKLSMLPELENLNLTDANGSSQLSKEDVKLLQASTNAVIDYTFDFFGKKISTADEEIIIQNVKIGDEGLPEVRLALDILPGCKRFVLENCQISNEEMAKLRDEYREQTKVVWRISFGKGTTLTDAQVIRAVYDLVDTNCDNLKYCEDARFMDIGHNEYLKTSEFISGMKSLEYVIVSGSMISDLKPFGNCKNLKVLEAAFCEYIESVEGLETCENLEYLNISNTHVTDLSPLDGLNLKDLCAILYLNSRSRVPQEEQERFQALKPDCEMHFTGHPYGSTWRYDEKNNPRPWYALIRSVFRYDRDPNIPNHVGWYYEEDTQAAQTTQTTQTAAQTKTKTTQATQPTEATQATEETQATEAAEETQATEG